MLTKVDVLAYWYKQKKYSIPLYNHLGTSEDHRKSFVIVGGNKRLVGICEHPHAASSMAGFDSQVITGFHTRPMRKVYPQITFDTDKAWLLRLTVNSAEWETNYNFENIEELAKSVLDYNKVCALDSVFTRVDYNRVLYHSDYDACQGRIYQAKVSQAKEVIDKQIQEDDLMEYPFISGYARCEGIDLQNAANRILIKNRVHEAGLSESENLRIKTKKSIMNATSMQELFVAYKTFKTVLTKYGNL